MRYFLELTYKGTSYNGWQIQNNAPSVQQTLQDALSTLLRCPIQVVGAGRTDTGVHAAYYVAHFDVEDSIPDTSAFTYHLNRLLPADIAVFSATHVPDEAHARFDAVAREYTYHILPYKNPFRQKTTWQYSVPLDRPKMNEAATLLLDYKDFTTFSKLHSNNKTNLCRIEQAIWTQEEDGELIFTIRADRFLRNMVRSIVGTLVEVGRGKRDVTDFRAAIESLDRSRAGSSAPAQGLFLSDIRYPEHLFIRKTNLIRSI